MKLNFEKLNGLIPTVIQHYQTKKVLMVGFMNEESWRLTLESRNVTFFSRTKNRIWMKGESSGNLLKVKCFEIDCDADSILIKVLPTGPVCHTGAKSCFNDSTELFSLYDLENVIDERLNSSVKGSYTQLLMNKGINKIAQKVGEEAVELVIESMDNNIELLKNEAADLLYHFLVLLKYKNTSLGEIEKILTERHQKNINWF